MKPGPTTDNLISERVKEHISIVAKLLADESYISVVTAVARELTKAIAAGNKLLFFGNGGSAADAQHLTAELTGRFIKERRALAAIALTTNTSSLTAIGNDYSYDLVFARQLEALGNSGDVAIGISTSGNSRNVVLAMEAATKKQLVTVGMIGAGSGRLKPMIDHCIQIPSDVTARIQEAHILTGHILCELVENEFCR